MNLNITKISIFFIILFNVVLFNSASFASASADNDSTKYVVTEDERFNKIFREGRDLIDKEDWKKAVEKFNEIVCDCPENKGVDAAFYWLAFCYKKLNMFKQMDETIERLLVSFPNSSWADDARVMKFDQPAASSFSTSRPNVAGKYPSKESSDALASEYYQIATTLYSVDSETKLDREDEIKLAAFQSLLSSNPARAIGVLGNILRTGSSASETLKREMLRTMRSPKFSGANVLTGFSNYEGFKSKTNDQLLPQLRETLVKSYKNESNLNVKKEIIYALSNINDDQSVNFLVQIYASENNKELKKAIIYSFGGSKYLSLSYSSAFSTTKSTHFDKLIEIGRNENDLELRRLVFSNLRRFNGWTATEGMIDIVSKLYDSETDEESKVSLIQSFAEAKENKATAKLLEIARNDKSDKMRLAAIRSLKNNTDPEVQKFLEDLIK
jgi:outer membrane protein assembly factor BamD (BamD/ComL family)